jgi:hypothetical protein
MQAVLGRHLPVSQAYSPVDKLPACFVRGKGGACVSNPAAAIGPAARWLQSVRRSCLSWPKRKMLRSTGSKLSSVRFAGFRASCSTSRTNSGRRSSSCANHEPRRNVTGKRRVRLARPRTKPGKTRPGPRLPRPRQRKPRRRCKRPLPLLRRPLPPLRRLDRVSQGSRSACRAGGRLLRPAMAGCPSR